MRPLGTATAIVALLLALPGLAAAKTYEPTRKDDPAPNGCKPNNCSLREAVLAANEKQNADTIRLGKGTYRLAIPDGAFDGAETGELLLYWESKVIGRGAGQTKVHGMGVDGVFNLTGLASHHTLRKLTVRGGAAKDENGDPDIGGGVRVGFAPTTLGRVVIIGNSAQSGGGIWSQSEELTISRSTISDNFASDYGGGIFSPATISPAVTRLRASTISGNDAAVGAGVGVDGFDPPMVDFPEPVFEGVNSTIAENDALVSGGGLSAIQGASASLNNVSVGFNKADSDNSGGGFGGGIYHSSDSTFIVDDSVIADNTAGSSGGGSQCWGDFTGTGNAISLSNGCEDFNNASNRLIPSEIALPLADNGGPTETMALQSFSSATGYANTCPTRDQRGKLRPANCDSGAFENKPKRG
jgi:CSLREA domain-containing protein